MILILLGPPGVGKGTQGAFLEEEPGWHRLGTGDLLREARRQGTELGRKAEEYMDQGLLVPDDLILDLVRERLRGLGSEAHVILDGFPRTVAQADGLDALLKEDGRKVGGVLLLDAPEETLVKRISGRRSCPDCRALYNVYFDRPAEAGRCDKCGAELVYRQDDQPDTVRNRLRVYHEQTAPLVRHYRGHDAPVLSVKGDRSLEEVRAEVRSALRAEFGIQV